MPESSCDSLRVVWNGVDGANYMYFYSTIIVSYGHGFLHSFTESFPVVMTKPKERDGVTKYNVNRRVRTAYPSR